MPNLFTLPGARSGDINFDSQYFMPYGSHYTVESGTTLYASLFRMFWADHNHASFTNHGTLWNLRSFDTAAVIVGFYVPAVINTGVMIAEATNGNAGTVYVGSGGATVDNSGSIYAIANGNATAVEHWDPDVTIRNSGLIAAYGASASTGGSGGVGSALGVAMFNGGLLTNGVGASILAEGIYATGILFGRGSLFGDAGIENAGRIEALTTAPGQPSYGIRTGGLAVESIYFSNSGLLKADIAWSSYGDHPLYAPMATDWLTNNVGGSIVGRIETGRGADSLVNNGSIAGDIALGDENDVFDTSGGTWTGAADLGWHDDAFLGSAGGDVVTGNRGNDQLEGAAGNDLLLGGLGHDWIVGGTGNDGLYGELGEDHLTTLDGDRAYGGDGNDVIVAGDLTFALISGGAGYDTLQFDLPAMQLDLGAAIATGRLEGIERIDLQGSQQIAVRAGDAAALAGGTLDIGGSGGTHVALVGNWVQGAASVRNGVSSVSFTLGNEIVYVEASVTVDRPGAMPAGFSGLAPVATGAAAPVAGSVPGGALANSVLTISWFTLDRAVVVDRGETWRANDASMIIGYSLTHGLVNGGVIEMTNGAGGTLYSVISNDVAYIINSGTIRGTGIGVNAINIRGTLQNSGRIEAIATTGRALAAEVGSPSEGLVFDNHGTISARASTGTAIGAQIDDGFSVGSSPVGTNHGLIEAVGGTGTMALNVLSGGTFLNEGTIMAGNSAGSGVTDATAVQLYNSSFLINRFVNHGSVVGVTAIRSERGEDDVMNSGRIEGAVILGEGADIVENAGAIVGRIALGDGTDLYLGAAATAAAEVDGGSGSDLIVGGVSGDRIDGGAGNDFLAGGGGADTLTGGEGADRFIYLAATDSTATATDTIQDFESGIDTLDLRALAPTGVTLSVTAGITTVSAQTASGAVTIRVSGSIALADIATAPGSSPLTGTSADDVLLGTAGNDRLDGGAGADVMYGGAGDDVYVIDSQADRLIERPGGGVDHVLAYGSYLLPDEVENLTLMIAGEAQGNSLDNVLRGSAGADGIIGYAGNDVLIGGLGADNLLDGLGIDRFVYESAADSTPTAPDVISGFGYGEDKIDLSSISVLSIRWTRVLDQFNSYEEVSIETADGPMKIRVGILNIATSGLSMSDFILAPQRASEPDSGDFNGDGRSDLIWQNANGSMTAWLGQPNGSFVSNAGLGANAINSTWHVADVGDFNGDGKDDILWRHSSGEIGEWLGQASGSFLNNGGAAANAVDNSWSIVGVADFNGDGRDDILWRHSSGEVGQWLGRPSGGFMNNGDAAANAVDPSWSVLATADFNGDGRGDVLWRHSSGVFAEWQGTATGALINVGGVLAGAAGSVVGTGDFDKDGRDDVLARASNGTITVWLGQESGQFASFTPTLQINDLKWTISSIGDFNGDGISDLLWQHNSGEGGVWLGTGSGDFAYNGPVPTVDVIWPVQSPDIHFA